MHVVKTPSKTQQKFNIDLVFRWASVGFPYLHGAWHILIFLASYTAIVLFAYFEVKNNYRTETPVLK